LVAEGADPLKTLQAPSILLWQGSSVKLQSIAKHCRILVKWL